MNILYVVKTFSVIEPMGVLQLCAIAKTRGHHGFLASIDDSNLEEDITQKKIDVVAYSFMSVEVKPFFELSRRLRQSFPKLIIVAGGPHPTYYPNIIEDWPIDALVVGEGDSVFNELIESLLLGKDAAHIPGVHTKQFKNKPGNLVDDLDTLPFSDRELVRDLAPFKYVRLKSFFATRGCPFNCAYCFNSAYNAMYKGKGKVLRRRSVESLVSEIETVTRDFPTDFIRFGDDTFVMKHDEWVDEFAEKYSARVGLPFYFLINPNLVTEDLVGVLKKAGCHSVMMGIETGNERLRKKILDRYVSNDTMLKAFRIFRDFDIKVFSNTMLGLPDSGLKEDLESLEFTLKCRPCYSGFTVFTPFPGTKLHQFSRDHGYLRNDDPSVDFFPVSMQQSSVLAHVTEQQKKMHHNILALAPIANFLPILKNLIVKHLIYWPPNRIFDFFGFIVRNYLNMKIWPFGKSPRTFLIILKKVIRIDRQNFIEKRKKQEFQTAAREVATVP